MKKINEGSIIQLKVFVPEKLKPTIVARSFKMDWEKGKCSFWWYRMQPDIG